MEEEKAIKLLETVIENEEILNLTSRLDKEIIVAIKTLISKCKE